VSLISWIGTPLLLMIGLRANGRGPV